LGLKVKRVRKAILEIAARRVMLASKARKD
jgi:hypothetical protein